MTVWEQIQTPGNGRNDSHMFQGVSIPWFLNLVMAQLYP